MSGEPTPPRSTLWALGVVMFLLSAFALMPRLRRSHAVVHAGADAPDFTLSLAANGDAVGNDTGTLSLKDLRGHAVLLDFWATWCQPCRAQAPIVDALARRWRERGVVVVGVGTDRPEEGDPGAFALARGLSYPIVRDDMGRASRAYGVEGLPTLVVVSPAGKIVAVRTGVTDDPELERLVRQAL
jgi:cytochrome c biogenesis protein CcmG, thiol:disulfide interchange protein DsbE